MEPAALTLLLQALFVLLAFGWRTVAQLRETGGTGFVAHRERGLQADPAGTVRSDCAQRPSQFCSTSKTRRSSAWTSASAFSVTSAGAGSAAMSRP